MSARLAQFDALLTRRRTPPAAAPHQTTRTLRDPWGEPVAEFKHTPSDIELLKAAHRLQGDDWLGVLADEAQGRGLNAAWRLALLRADRHGRPRLSAQVGPQWLSAAVAERPGVRPAVLRRDLCAAAVRQLWASGWKLVG
ncbi:hypothetical protein SAMN05216359_101708 [Roseateles sp. YR242]|uniref:hypothetical protein n=1 Tax=Roseateles sp. YR242 TaxID=1855305 RepID=UPI0008C91762|nr:hypothetical protein [Roseateles sp. YR242]SEK40313.1 hypothetical protein SAMN05216359_101708 [Roseateles sp. YR242]